MKAYLEDLTLTNDTNDKFNKYQNASERMAGISTNLESAVDKLTCCLSPFG